MILALTRVRPYKSKAYCCDKKTIFETKKAPYFSSLYDIEDLMISSTGMKYEHKKEAVRALRKTYLDEKKKAMDKRDEVI